ncbi:MAG: hypothetical protein ACYTEW_24640 [Planctomycetota bacterium]|jgi:hypothetical protein
MTRAVTIEIEQEYYDYVCSKWREFSEGVDINKLLQGSEHIYTHISAGADEFLEDKMKSLDAGEQVKNRSRKIR